MIGCHVSVQACKRRTKPLKTNCWQFVTKSWKNLFIVSNSIFIIPRWYLECSVHLVLIIFWFRILFTMFNFFQHFFLIDAVQFCYHPIDCHWSSTAKHIHVLKLQRIIMESRHFTKSLRSDQYIEIWNIWLLCN